MNAPEALPVSLEAKEQAAIALLREAAREHGPAVHSNSFQAEGVVLARLIALHVPEIETVSLDTGRLPEQTLAVADALRQRYGLAIRWLYPDPELLEPFTATHGPNAFYESVELRRRCCHIRKVLPLEKALAGKRAWITGRRADEGGARIEMPAREWDEGRGVFKFNPLADWSRAQVWAYIKQHDVPYNTLHDQHYPSIGCAPCTRAITVGEDPRAGRWWWEQGEVRECGLHRPVHAVAAEPAPEPATVTPDVGL